MRRFLSGFLAMLTVLSTILSPILSYAADVVPEEPPLYEKVKNELDADEVVKAKDLELETGSIFEVEKDFTGLEIPDEKKVKITFHEAKMRKSRTYNRLRRYIQSCLLCRASKWPPNLSDQS